MSRTLERGIDIPTEKKKFQRLLLQWYDANKRDLPWRRERDPYHIWVSEIMLQQTRVNAVLEHYKKFFKRFPTIHSLANAREASVLAIWSGLGYYRRARMMHAAAKKVIKDLGGKFPTTETGLRELPGIGRYTAAAIASIAFNEPTAVVDGNVERVLQRLSGEAIPTEQIWATANEVLDPKRPGDFNQAMMELGATVCMPRGPLCMLCPVIELCHARGEINLGRAATPQKKREISYVLAREGQSVFLVQRPMDASLMAGMWELPQGQPNSRTNGTCLTLRHSITVTDYRVRVFQGEIPDNTLGNWVREKRLAKLPLTGLARKILRAAELM
ncbi:MAG TPA: A/G-specific adenine glycosylase [Terriglobales bacterium]|nr:A/G-specific adenine glycosylase [Terriglobales bacterium]